MHRRCSGVAEHLQATRFASDHVTNGFDRGKVGGTLIDKGTTVEVDTCVIRPAALIPCTDELSDVDAFPFMQTQHATGSHDDVIVVGASRGIDHRTLSATDAEFAIDFDGTGAQRGLTRGTATRFNIDRSATGDLSTTGEIIGITNDQNVATVRNGSEAVLPLRTELKVVRSSQDVVDTTEGKAGGARGDPINTSARIPGIWDACTQSGGVVGHFTVESGAKEGAAIPNACHIEIS